MCGKEREQWNDPQDHVTKGGRRRGAFTKFHLCRAAADSRCFPGEGNGRFPGNALEHLVVNIAKLGEH